MEKLQNNPKIQEVFYLRLVDDPSQDCMQLTCSMDLEKLDNQDVMTYTGCIQERVVDETMRYHILSKLFDAIHKVREKQRLKNTQ